MHFLQDKSRLPPGYLSRPLLKLQIVQTLFQLLNSTLIFFLQPAHSKKVGSTISRGTHFFPQLRASPVYGDYQYRHAIYKTQRRLQPPLSTENWTSAILFAGSHQFYILHLLILNTFVYALLRCFVS